MEQIEALLEWGATQGIRLNGIQPKPIPGRGIGVVATRRIKADEDVLDVPTNALRSLANTPKPILKRLKGASVQAILAVSMCLDATPEFGLWKGVFPSDDDVVASMPLCWPPKAQELLPSTAKRLLAKQQAKFDRDWASVSAAWLHESHEGYDDLTLDGFKNAWLLANSRTFYHTTPRTRRLPKDDHMVMQPVADLFNHTSGEDYCRAAYDTDGFTVTTAREHEAGEELFVRYGAHSNDFLLVEYGFTLPLSLNEWDETRLDPYLCPLIVAKGTGKKELLEGAGFWGHYMLDGGTVCYRTQMALRIVCLTEKQWVQVRDGERDEDEDADAANEVLHKVLRAYEKDVRKTLNGVAKATVDETIKESLRTRWLQIKELVDAALHRLEGNR